MVENPVVDGETKLGERLMLIGPLVKFMEPKEVVMKFACVRVLSEDEVGLLLLLLCGFLSPILFKNR